MRIGKATLFLLLSGLLICVDTSFAQVTDRFDRTVSGRVLYRNAEFSCKQCVVHLLKTGGHSFASAHVDLGGRFTFRNLPRGTYTIGLEIEGFESVRHDVDVGFGFGQETDVTILLTRRAFAIQAPTDHVVDASDFLERFPKKAVDAFNRGLKSRNRNKIDEAMKHFEEAVRIAPDFYRAHNELGIAYKHAGRFVEAEQEFLRAGELNRSSADPLVNLTSLYIEEDKPDRAVRVGEQAVSKNSRSAPAFFNLGLALYKISMLDRAEGALRKALELSPKMAAVRLMLANVYLKLRNRDKLMEQLDGYLAENPDGDYRRSVVEIRARVLAASPDELP